jgi:hypothetical protein
VLWAITPEGRATNLGEIQTDNDDESKLNVTSDLQAFAMIVTAEPYFSVTQPSDVVVMENAVRRDTVGQVEMVDANYELLKRGEYSYDTAAAAQANSGKREKLPMHRYEALLAIYQAQNAVQIAQSLGAERLAAESYAKASRLLLTARQYYDNKGDSKSVIQTARQAAQTAEDARLITIAKLSSASFSTSSIVDTRCIFIVSSTFFGMSARSFSLSLGSTMVFTPARWAARTFSFTPPIGRTLPRKVISPVIATSRRVLIFARAEIMAVASVMPAEGPSFGIAPSGMCTCTSRRRLKSFGMPNSSARERM